MLFLVELDRVNPTDIPQKVSRALVVPIANQGVGVRRVRDLEANRGRPPTFAGRPMPAPAVAPHRSPGASWFSSIDASHVFPETQLFLPDE